MKFTIKNDIFIANLQKINRLLTKNISLPILENILLEIKDGILSLTSTNLDAELISNIHIENEYQEGKITVSGRKILDICRHATKNSYIHVKLQNNKIYINSKNSNYILTTLPAKNFPKNQNVHNISKFSIFSNVLKEMIEKTEFSMGKQDVRYYLNGMLLEKSGTILRIVATDGYRLAMSSSIIEKDIVEFSIIIPRKGIVELSRLLNTESTLINVLIGTNNIKIHINKLIFTIQLLEGQYPDYKSVLFKKSNNPIIINAIALKKSLSRVSILSHEKFYGIEIHFSNGKLKVLSNNQDDEMAEDEFNIEYFDKKIEFSINVYYILDILNVIYSKNIFLFFNESQSSIQITEENDSSIVYIIMLLRR